MQGPPETDSGIWQLGHTSRGDTFWYQASAVKSYKVISMWTKLAWKMSSMQARKQAVIDNLRKFRENIQDAVHDNIQQAQTKMKEAHR